MRLTSTGGVSRATLAVGILCGAGAASCWAAGFVAAKHGITAGMAPADLALHRFLWTGLPLLALLAREGLADLAGIGWRRGIALMLLGGPVQAFMAYKGFTLVPLGHGGVIQPACAALFGIALATLVLRERPTFERLVGAGAIVTGLLIFGAEALATIGSHGVGGDLLFVGAGALWATFGTTLRLWSVAGTRAAMIVGALAVLFYTPTHALLFGYERMLAVGFRENLLQAAVQGGLAGVLAIYLFARAVTLLGAGRASTFPALVPVLTMALGFLLLGEAPSMQQLVGLAIVLVGFRFALKA
jgi:drug/metabolite transporter (DMT)-like permease